MGTHLSAFVKSITSTVLVNLSAVQDDILTAPQADRFFVDKDFSTVNAAAALGVDLQRGTLDSPSLEVKRASPEIVPHENGAAKFTLSAPKIWFPRGEFALVPGEALTAPAANNAAGANKVYTGVWFKKPGALPGIPSGDIITVRATGTTTCVGDAWTSCPITLDKDLPAGQYALIDFVPMSVSGVFARALIPGQSNRPGSIVYQGAAENASRAFDFPTQYKLNGYEMGRFSNQVLPQFQFLCTAADTAQTLILYVVKVA